jgi:sugar phosphate isomerase/epimerase
MSLPKFGMLTNPSINIIKEINTVIGFGFDYVEIGIEEPEGKPEKLNKKINEIKSLLQKNNKFATGHFAWWAELGTTNETVRKSWLVECKKAIEFCSKLEIKKLTVHSHARGIFLSDKRLKKIILDNYIKSLKELVSYGRRFNVNIMLENAVEKREITSLDDFRYIVNRVPGLKVHIDIGHAFIWGGMKNTEKFITVFGNKIEHVHLHDNHGKFDEHLPIGKGKINWRRVVSVLRKINYEKTITLEIFSENRENVVKSREKIKNLFRDIK